jgi:hypothetical protein
MQAKKRKQRATTAPKLEPEKKNFLRLTITTGCFVHPIKQTWTNARQMLTDTSLVLTNASLGQEPEVELQYDSRISLSL